MFRAGLVLNGLLMQKREKSRDEYLLMPYIVYYGKDAM